MSNVQITQARYNEEKELWFTPKVRFLWPNFFVAKRIKGKPDSRPNFSATGLIPAKSNLDAMLAAEAAVAKEKGFAKMWATSTKLYHAIRKTSDHDKLGDYAKEYPHYFVFKSSEEYPPTIFGPDKQKITDPAKAGVYGGRWGVVSGRFYGYDNLSKGVNFSLDRVQLADHDDRIGGGRLESNDGFEEFDVAEQEFADEEEDFNS